jgi:hypothetical protein
VILSRPENNRKETSTQCSLTYDRTPLHLRAAQLLPRLSGKSSIMKKTSVEHWWNVKR